MSVGILQCLPSVKKKRQKNKVEQEAQNSQKISKFLGMTLEQRNKREMFVPKQISQVFQTLSEVNASCSKAGFNNLCSFANLYCFYSFLEARPWPLVYVLYILLLHCSSKGEYYENCAALFISPPFKEGRAFPWIKCSSEFQHHACLFFI